MFSKFSKDYQNLLEEILEKKTFSSISKSLLFSMIYKLEVSYKDYTVVKPRVLTKDEFLSHMLEVIQKYCDNIKTVEPESVGAELLIKHKVEAVTNYNERSILVYPTEQAMLYAISDIEPKYFFVKKDFIFKKVLQKVLVEGYKQNTVEILKNFNGWSWDISFDKTQNHMVYLMYQNLLMIKGEQFLFEWRTDHQVQQDYLMQLKHAIRNITGNDEYYWSFCRVLYKMANRKEKSEMTQMLQKKEQKYQNFLLQDKEFKKKNLREFQKLKQYHEMLNNEKTLQEEFLELQKLFLQFLEKKLARFSFREEILEMISILRYYQNYVFLIKEYKKLLPYFDYIQKLTFTKACEIGVLKIICMNIEVNFEILKYIFDTRIIDLEDIKIYLEQEDGEILMKVYDKEVFEKQGKIAFQGNKKDIAIKKKKMVSIFN